VDVATHVENISNVKDQRTLVNAMIQVALNRVYQFHDWPFYLDFRNGILTTTDDYSTGTADVTNGSTTISGTTTVWTAAMVGRKIRIANEKPYYRITARSGDTSITIDKAYQGSTATEQTYSIFQDEYRLNADVDKYKSFRQIQNGLLTIDLLPKNFDELFPTPQALSDPYYSIYVGNDTQTYTTGTLGIATSTVTGSGTAWSSIIGITKRSRIRVGSNWYTVNTVDSDTQITIYETVTVTAGASYVIPLDNIVVQLYNIPNAARHLYYRYFRLPIPLVNDYDSPDMPPDYHHLLIWGALSEILSQKGDINKAENVYESRFLNGLQQMKLKIGSFAPDRKYGRKSADRIKRGATIGLEASTFSRWFSS